MKNYIYFAFAGLFASSLFGIQTKVITHSSVEHFIKGSAQNFSIFDNQGLEAIAPIVEITTLPTDVVFDVKENSDGELLIATGNPARVLLVDKSGETNQLFKSDELFAKAIALTNEGQLFIGTSPSGKVYKRQADQSVELFFSPDAKYIWDIEILPTGEILIATGEPAYLYKIPPTYQYGEKVEPLFSFTQKHFTKINTDKNESILLGTSPDALLFELDLEGNIQRTINSKGTEVTQISHQPDGVYFSTISAPQLKASSKKKPKKEVNPKPKDRLYRWNDNGFLDSIWNDGKKSIFTFLVNKDEVIIGSGSEGHIFASKDTTNWGIWNQLPKGGDVNHIIKSSITPEVRYFITSNPANIYKQAKRSSEKSVFTSKIIDASQIVSWGKLHMIGQTINQAKLRVRFGNTEKPDTSWSEWQVEDLTTSQNSQYAQYQIETDSGLTKIAKIKWYYRLANQAPEIGIINVVPISVGSINIVQKPEEQLDVNKLFAGKSLENVLVKNKQNPQKFFLENNQNHITVSWQSRDANQDELSFQLFIKKIGQSDWVALAKNLETDLYTFSTNGMDPGYYKIKVSATDQPSNPIDFAKSVTKISEQFLIDNTNPQIRFLGKNTDSQGVTHLKFEVKDDFSIINEANVLVNGEKKYFLIPDDGFFDQTLEKFSLKLASMSIGIHSLVFEVKDESRNQSMYQNTFTIE